MTSRRTPVRLCAAIAATATVVLTAGVPAAHEADHDDDHAHVEQGHGGHDHFVVLETGRVTTPNTNVPPLPAFAVTWTAPVAGGDRHTVSRVDLLPHSGRDPPDPELPRGPPTLL